MKSGPFSSSSEKGLSVFLRFSGGIDDGHVVSISITRILFIFLAYTTVPQSALRKYLGKHERLLPLQLEGCSPGGGRARSGDPEGDQQLLDLARTVQFNRKAREARKETARIHRADPEKLGEASRKISVRQLLRGDESWRVFAILAVLAAKFLGLVHSAGPWDAPDVISWRERAHVR